MRTQKLCSDDSSPSQLQSLAGDLQLAEVEGQMNGKLHGVSQVKEEQIVKICLYVHDMCSSVYDCECMVSSLSIIIRLYGTPTLVAKNTV